ncbi:MAG: hemerythrin domain-containing protein, partial [Caulobacteraceae bacterium]
VLNGHSMAEEAVIYPELARLGKEAHADMAYLQQVAAKMQLAALERLDPASQEYADKLGHLEGAVVHHVYKEESDWFLDLKENVSAADEQRILQRYGEEFERYMRGGEGPAAGAKPVEERGIEPKSFQPRSAT